MLPAQLKETEGLSVMVLHPDVIFAIIYRCTQVVKQPKEHDISNTGKTTTWWMSSVICRKLLKKTHWSGRSSKRVTLNSSLIDFIHTWISSMTREEGWSVQKTEKYGLNIFRIGSIVPLPGRRRPD